MSDLSNNFKAVHFLILALFLLLINISSITSQNIISSTSYASQRIALNKLRKPNLKHPSEIGPYPNIDKKNIKLVAIKRTNRLYVNSKRKTLYIINAKVNLNATKTSLNSARGTISLSINNNDKIESRNWISFGQNSYIESPYLINENRGKKNWFKNNKHLSNTIEVSEPDAKWLQDLPKGTSLTVK